VELKAPEARARQEIYVADGDGKIYQRSIATKPGTRWRASLVPPRRFHLIRILAARTSPTQAAAFLHLRGYFLVASSVLVGVAGVELLPLFSDIFPLGVEE
jgi:hypothetical protein